MSNPYTTQGGNPFQGDNANENTGGGQQPWYNPENAEAAETQPYSLPSQQGGIEPVAAPVNAEQPQWVDPNNTGPSVRSETQQQQQQAGGGGNPSQTPDLVTAKFWTIEFYQQFFDVDTKDVLNRMGNVLLPCTPPDFLQDRHWHMGNLPGGMMPGALSNAAAAFGHGQGQGGGSARADLYGPLWISTTLWVTLAIVGNIMGKLAHERRAVRRANEINNIVENAQTLAAGQTHPPLWTPEPLPRWTYDFTAASAAAAAVYAYIIFMSFLVWGLMKWKSVPVGLTDAVCLYGYSMFVFLLSAILCAVPVSPFQWLVCFLGTAWSCSYLLLNMWQLWKVSLEKPWFIGLVILVLGSQLALTIGFKLYFFNYDF